MAFTRSKVEAEGRALYYWMPDELLPHTPAVSQSVLGALVARL
jgi:hypothetical protein